MRIHGRSTNLSSCIEKSNNITKLEVWQAEQYIINVNASEDKVQTLHLKFYDFDIFLDFVLVKK